MFGNLYMSVLVRSISEKEESIMYSGRMAMKTSVFFLVLAMLLCTSLMAAQADERESIITEFYQSTFKQSMSKSEWEECVIEQSNRHNMNRFVADNSWIYGVWAGEKGKGEVVKVRYNNSDWTVLDENTNEYYAYCLGVKNGYVYYSQELGNGTCEVVKVRTSGKDATVIVKEHYGSVQLIDKYIYYTTPEIVDSGTGRCVKNSTNLWRSDTNGSNAICILDKPVYYFSVWGDYVLYQDDMDNMTLHLFNMVTGQDVRLNDAQSFWPIYDGEYIYYLSNSDNVPNYGYGLFRMTADGRVNEEIYLECGISGLLMSGDYLYYINEDDDARVYRCMKDGSEVEQVTQDGYVYTMQFVKNNLVYVPIQDNAYKGFYICGLDGSNVIEFTKSKDYWYLR